MKKRLLAQSRVFLGNQHEIYSKQHNGKASPLIFQTPLPRGCLVFHTELVSFVPSPPSRTCCPRAWSPVWLTRPA